MLSLRSHFRLFDFFICEVGLEASNRVKVKRKEASGLAYHA